MWFVVKMFDFQFFWNAWIECQQVLKILGKNFKTDQEAYKNTNILPDLWTEFNYSYFGQILS